MGADHDPLPYLITGDADAKFGYDADRFMADGQTRLDRIFALENVYVRTAYRRRRDFDQRLTRADFWNRFFVEDDLTRFDENQAAFMVRMENSFRIGVLSGRAKIFMFSPAGKALLEMAGRRLS